MSSRRKSRKNKKAKHSQIDLNAVVSFVRFIQCLSCGMFGVSVIALFLVKEDVSAQVIYTMVILVNLVIMLGGKVPINYLEKRINS